jgi:uncharacterized protein (DUF1778 family)
MGCVAKSERVDLRLEPDDDELIRRAAEECGMSVSAFLVTSARERAERVVIDRAFGLLDDDAWDDFVARLEAPPTYKWELRKLFAEPDIFE